MSYTIKLQLKHLCTINYAHHLDPTFQDTQVRPNETLVDTQQSTNKNLNQHSIKPQIFMYQVKSNLIIS